MFPIAKYILLSLYALILSNLCSRSISVASRTNPYSYLLHLILLFLFKTHSVIFLQLLYQLQPCLVILSLICR